MPSETITNDLIQAAQSMRKRAYAPYSRYTVGAALLGKSGKIYHGVNVENASYGLTVCAERNAVFQAVAQGERRFESIVIATGGDVPAPPCGACLAVLAEFAPNLRIFLVGKNKKKVLAFDLKELLPHSFSLNLK